MIVLFCREEIDIFVCVKYLFTRLCFYAVFMFMWVLLCGVRGYREVTGCFYAGAYDCGLSAKTHEGEQDFSHLLTVCPREDI